ncbi:transmembrane protein 132E isoform X2 [Rhineura floridana]|uniref:transmembrane protein 132E isoform X2 n=1 Tax=Rhineura floridana TaxID=261503 RepID=UPI002AC812F9|nr:transmembrane protein 132E isoform X2 [Rhineura floridana]XP_061461130.1 transmembrane protein 132E isoform X2 [Rhineura floridana]
MYTTWRKAHARVLPTSSEPPETPQPPAAAMLPVSYRLSNTRMAFFLREMRPPPNTNASASLTRSEPFVVFQTKDLPVLNISLGPFSSSLALPKELLQPSSTLEVPEHLTVNWKVRAFIVRTRVPASQPTAQVLFYVAGRDWDDFSVTERLPCVRLHAFREARELRASCRLRGILASCLVQAELPQAWFGPAAVPLGRRKAPEGMDPAGHVQQVELYYTLHAPDGMGDCGSELAGRRGGGGARTEGPTQHPLLRIGSLRLFQPPPPPPFQEQRLDDNVFVRLPDKPLRPGEVLRVILYLMKNSTVEHFTLRVKAKKGVNLLTTKSRDPNWLVNSEFQTGSKHSTSTVEVSWIGGAQPRAEDSPCEIMQLDFEMENFTSQSVTRRIMWHIDYRGHSPPPDLEKAVTELTVIQRDIRAILPLAMDTEIINTAILTGRTVAIPVKVIAIEMTGVIVDVLTAVACKSTNEDIIKVSSSCDYVFVSGKESRGSMNAGVSFTYEHLTALLEMTVWVPKLPLHIELSDLRLSQVKGWRVPVLPDRRSVRESEDDDEEEEQRQSRGCTLQYQHTTLQVFTQFHTTSSEGTDQVVTMLGPEWMVEVTDLVSDFMKVDDPQVARMVDTNTLAGREPGTTLFKVVSPLMEAVLGEALVTVADEKVSITELKAQLISNLSLSLHPSPGNSHTIVAKTTAQQTLNFSKQEALLSLWVSYSDGTTAPLSLYNPKDYTLVVTSQDRAVVSVMPDRAFPLVMAEGEGAGELVKAELMICESCQKTKRKSVLATAMASVRVHFSSEEEPTYDYEPVQTPSRPGQERGAPGTTPRVEGEWHQVPSQESRVPSVILPTEDFPTIPTGYVQVTRGLTDLEIGMYALLGVFCLAILVFLINCIVFVLKYRHKRIPPEGQTNMDHSHHWVFLGNGQPLRAQNDLSPQPENLGNPLESVPTCCHADHHSSGSSQTSVQSQVHGRGDGSSGGSTRDQSEDPLNSPTSKRKRVKFTTFATMPSEELAYNSIPVADEEDLEWVCQDMGLQDPEELHNYIHRIKETA